MAAARPPADWRCVSPGVHATDPSAAQIAQHWGRAGCRPPSREPSSHGPRRGETGPTPTTNVTLAIEPGERTVLADDSVQLVAVAQALHWFDREAFFAECARVLAPGGVLAAWGYPDFIVPDGMEAAVADYRAMIEPHWPPERVQIDTRYAGYDWPFPALPAPRLSLQATWSLPRFIGYLSSNSARAPCLAATGIDPVERHGPALAAAWGEVDAVRTIRWPLFLHLRRKPDR